MLLLVLALAIQVSARQYEGKGCLYYLASEPDNVNSSTPIIILLHGYGSNEKDLFELRAQLPAQAIIIAARAPQTISPGSFAWYNLDFSKGTPVGKASEMLGSIEKVQQFIGEIKSKYSNTNKVYLLGFSQGSIMSMGIALIHPEKVSGIVALSGRLPEDILKKNEPQGKIKPEVFMGHGSTDKIIDVTLARAAKAHLLQCGLKPEYHEYEMGHQISGPEMHDIQQWFAARLR